MLTGGCLCGATRYRVAAGPGWAGHCHCTMCRRSSGAPFVTWFTVPAAAVEWEGAPPTRHRSSKSAERGHCATCGAQMFWQGRDDPENLDLTAATLDDPSAVRPQMHIYWNDRMPGMEIADGLPRHQGGRRSPIAKDKVR